MDEDGYLFGDERNVRAAGNAFVVETITSQAGMPKSLSQSDLGFGVFGPIAAHDARDGFALWRG